MKIIAVIAVIAVVLFDVLGVIPKSSVGGPLTLALVYLAAILAVGIHDAWTNRRGVFGWIGSLLMALVGGLAGLWIGSVVMETILMNLALGEPLATSSHPLRYLGPVAMMLMGLTAAWGALQAVNRWR